MLIFCLLSKILVMAMISNIQLPLLPVGDTVAGTFGFLDRRSRDDTVTALVHIWLNPIIRTGENAYIANDALLHLMHVLRIDELDT